MQSITILGDGVCNAVVFHFAALNSQRHYIHFLHSMNYEVNFTLSNIVKDSYLDLNIDI